LGPGGWIQDPDVHLLGRGGTRTAKGKSGQARSDAQGGCPLEEISPADRIAESFTVDSVTLLHVVSLLLARFRPPVVLAVKLM
jgi:hypothetical protein